MQKGIDVSYAQGKIDWRAVRAAGVEFAMVKASQGKLSSNPKSGSFTDPRFYENVAGASENGIAVGAYHYLCASNVDEALAEAEYFIRALTPVREKITLWAVCDAEEERYLPKDKRALTGVVHGFLKKVRAAGFRPMLYTNPNYLKYRLNDLSLYDLWLAYWGTTEARALAYSPKIWQYGVGGIGGLTQVDMDRGYF